MEIVISDGMDVTKHLKVGNIVTVTFNNYWNTGCDCEVTTELKIISELRHIVYLEDGKSLSKPTGFPYNFYGKTIKIKTKD